MKTGLLILLVSILFVACNNRDHIPGSVLKPSKMQAVLLDIVRADQLLNEHAIRGDSLANSDSERIKLYQKVFQIHNITKEKFQQSFSFYRTHPAVLKIILDSLNNSTYSAPTEIAQPKSLTPVPIQ